MPRIIITTDPDGVPLHDERVCVSDLESEHFATQLIERVTWAISDAESAEREHGERDDGGRLRA
jgi:hypothetical protein